MHLSCHKILPGNVDHEACNGMRLSIRLYLQLLAIPRHNLSFGFRSFRVSAPRIWTSLTPQIRQCQTLATFRRHLKTHYFQSVFSAT